MSTRPVIFISAVSKELRSTRDLVAKTLHALGYEPRWQDIAPTDAGDLRAVLRKWVDQSDAVLQLVGHCYGFAPRPPSLEFSRCSYTQYEALYARKRGKPVYYLFIDEPHPKDGCACGQESKALHDLQEKYRQEVKTYREIYHHTSSLTQTELLVRRMEDKLADLRKRHRQHAALVLGLLVVLVLGGIRMMSGQSHSKKQLEKLSLQNQELKQGQADLRQMLETSINGGSESKLTADYLATLRFIADKRGISLEAFRAFLDQNTTHALGDAAVSLKDKVRALQEAGQFMQASDFAVEQARRLESGGTQINKEAAELWTEAAKTEITLGHYGKGLEYATKAVNQSDRQSDFSTWSAARHQQGRALRYMAKVKDALALYEELIPLQQATLGPNHVAVLQSRRLLAVLSFDLGNYPLAEQQLRSLVAVCQRILGPEHPDTLMNRNNLAAALQAQSKYAEAEQEFRSVLKLQKGVLGLDHPDALKSWMNLANALNSQGKPAEAEQEHRAVLKLRERVQGAEHPDTLMSRMNLAIAMDAQGKHAEAEQVKRAVLQLQERVLGAEHPDVALSCFNLALCLEDQHKLPEALQYMQQTEQLRMKVLGPDHPDTKLAKAERQRLEAALK